MTRSRNHLRSCNALPQRAGRLQEHPDGRPLILHPTDQTQVSVTTTRLTWTRRILLGFGGSGLALLGAVLVFALNRHPERSESPARWPIVAADHIRRFSPPHGWRPLSLAWMGSSGHMVVSVATVGDFGRIGLFVTDPRGSSWRKLRVPTKPPCEATGEILPFSLAPTKVAFVAMCFGDKVQPERFKDIRVYSFRTGRVSRLFPYWVGPASGGFSADATRARWLQNDGVGLEESLRWLRPSRRSAPLRLGLDRVGDPVWSPRASAVIVPGAGGLEGVEGVNRTFATWTLYVLDPDTLRLRTLVGGLVDGVQRGAWSPDGKLYAVSLRSRSGQNGIALVRVRDKRVVIVRPGSYGEVAWLSRDVLAAITMTADGRETRSIEVFSASDAVTSLSA